MKKSIIVMLCAFVFASCQTETTYQTVNIKKQYSLELPSFLEKTNDLNDAASLQYQNPFKEFYVIVVDESKTAFVNAVAAENAEPTDYFTDYSDIGLSSLKSSLTDFDFSGIKNTTIHGLNARTFSISGTIEGFRIFYKVAHIETEKNFYQVLIWTLEDRKEKYDYEMEKIISSFKETQSRSRDKS